MDSSSHSYIGLDGLLQRLGGSKGRRGEEYLCLCPVHGDHKPSLYVRETGKGLVMKCMVGCDNSAICDRLGIPMSALFRDAPEGRRSGDAKPRREETAPAAKPARQFDSYAAAYGRIGKVVKVYPYTTGDGTLLFEVARIRLADGDKTFRQHRPANPQKGTFPIICSVPADIRRGALYRLPEVEAAVRDGRTVYVVEGEKDADTLAGMGLVGTTCPGGAKSWTREHSAHLDGADVVILPDNDEPGEAHGKLVADLTVQAAKRVRLVRLCEAYDAMPPKGDISDLVQLVGAERAMEILQRAADAAPSVEQDLYGVACAAFGAVPGYCVSNGCICQSTEDGPRVLGTFVALPIREVTMDDGITQTMQVEIAGWASSGAQFPTITVDMDKYNSLSWSTGRWGLAANIMPGTTVRDKLRMVVTAAGAQVATKHTIYSHTGWRKVGGQWAYLYNGGAIGAKDTEVQLPDKLAAYTLANVPDGISAADAMLSSLSLTWIMDKRISVPMLGMMYLAPLREFFQQAGCAPTFMAMLKGGTQTHKSTAAALFLSHFGEFPRDDALPVHFSSTANAIRRMAFQVKDMPLVIDDYHPVASMQERRRMESVAQALARAFGNGDDRTRMSADLSLQSSMPPRSLAIITGEEVPDIGESGLGRLYMIEVKKDDIPGNDDLTDAQRRAVAGDFRAAMRGYVEWLAGRASGLPRRLSGMFLDYRAQARQRLEGRGAGDRATQSIAHIMIGLRLMLDYACEIGVVGEDAAQIQMEDYWECVLANAFEQISVSREERPLALYMRAVRELIATRAVTVLDIGQVGGEAKEPGRDSVGYCDERFYYIYPQKMFGDVCKFYEAQGRTIAATEREMQRMLREEGIVLPANDGKATRNKRVGSKQYRLLHFPRWRIDGGRPPEADAQQMRMDEFHEVDGADVPEQFTEGGNEEG